jgi:hypothetical protein
MVLAIDEVVLDVARPDPDRSPQTHADTVIDFALHSLVADRSRIGRILRAVSDYSGPALKSARKL